MNKQDISNLSDAEYKESWKNPGKIEIKLVEKIGECKHNLGDTYIYRGMKKTGKYIRFTVLTGPVHCGKCAEYHDEGK